MISIIVCIYKIGNKKLKRCIESIISNGNKKEYECILVNDNSPLEEDLFICKNIEENNDNFRVINLENNVGLSRARNIGMKAAKGDIVCFVDADDTISNQYVSTLKSAFASNKEIEVFLINKNLIYDSNYMNNFSNNDIEISFNNKYKSTPNKVFISGLGGCFIVLRKSFLDKYNLFFPENRKYAEDVY